MGRLPLLVLLVMACGALGDEVQDLGGADSAIVADQSDRQLAEQAIRQSLETKLTNANLKEEISPALLNVINSVVREQVAAASIPGDSKGSAAKQPTCSGTWVRELINSPSSKSKMLLLLRSIGNFATFVGGILCRAPEQTKLLDRKCCHAAFCDTKWSKLGWVGRPSGSKADYIPLRDYFKKKDVCAAALAAPYYTGGMRGKKEVRNDPPNGETSLLQTESGGFIRRRRRRRKKSRWSKLKKFSKRGMKAVGGGMKMKMVLKLVGKVAKKGLKAFMLKVVVPLLRAALPKKLRWVSKYVAFVVKGDVKAILRLFGSYSTQQATRNLVRSYVQLKITPIKLDCACNSYLGDVFSPGYIHWADARGWENKKEFGSLAKMGNQPLGYRSVDHLKRRTVEEQKQYGPFKGKAYLVARDFQQFVPFQTMKAMQRLIGKAKRTGKVLCECEFEFDLLLCGKDVGDSVKPSEGYDVSEHIACGGPMVSRSSKTKLLTDTPFCKGWYSFQVGMFNAVMTIISTPQIALKTKKCQASSRGGNGEIGEASNTAHGQGRRGGSSFSAGSSFVMSSGNRAGNSERISRSK